ncbi:undecaprenyl-diphosphate phosphatase [Nanchangia anserum]|uniref:Undecaprenyl-diphosphatase n=1 Tax=Nanchangia anserum TaxID=2692125 RepID=A0A8I0G6H6_9ACTO|nr:undecaprenyl-diphosphate phosphatase [Nanchangia anserum]MBD3688680.1 undecaprenyl-diphosphate phosphatase [Nanchangia anserum]QOX82431.1 undecaprenyl-diphosphate phosphatase [Nanchangia anserum]
MNYGEALLLGLIQGLTEFLPISSSAHLRIASEFLGRDAGAAFTAIIQIGTELAVLVYFFSDIVRIIRSWALSLPIAPARSRVPSNDPDARMGWMIIVGSLPIGLLGLALESWIDSSFRNLWITVVMLIAFALLLGLADRYGSKRKSLEQLSWRDAITFGFAQALALIPGVSRSGGTIMAGRFMGYSRVAAARYSFLLAMPAVFASGLYKAVKALAEGNDAGWGPTLVATVVSFVVGYAVIVWFLRLVETKTFTPFVIYRIVLAFVVAGCLLAGVIPALSSVGSL